MFLFARRLKEVEFLAQHPQVTSQTSVQYIVGMGDTISASLLCKGTNGTGIILGGEKQQQPIYIQAIADNSLLKFS